MSKRRRTNPSLRIIPERRQAARTPNASRNTCQVNGSAAQPFVYYLCINDRNCCSATGKFGCNSSAFLNSLATLGSAPLGFLFFAFVHATLLLVLSRLTRDPRLCAFLLGSVVFLVFLPCLRNSFIRL